MPEELSRSYEAGSSGNEGSWRTLTGAGARNLSTGNTADAVNAFERAHQLVPTHAATQMNLAAALLRAKRPADALPIFSALRVQLPADANVHRGIGLALFALGDRDGALNAFWEAAFHNPDAWSAWGSIAETTPDESERQHALRQKADALLRLCERKHSASLPIFACVKSLIDVRRFDEAATLTQARATDFARPATPFDLMARIAYRRGRFEDALRHKRQAFLRIRPEDIDPATPSTLDPVAAMAALREVTALLDRHGVGHFVAAGTLLGFVRNGAPLPHDRDIDIGILPLAGKAPDVLRILRAEQDFFAPPKASPADRYFGLQYKGIALDFFVHHADQGHWTCGISNQPGDIQWRFSKFELTRVAYEETLWSVPDDPERYLAESYGPAWRQPDKGFASAISSPALFNVDPHTRAYFAVARAAKMVRVANVEKADALLRQSPIPVAEMARKLSDLSAAYRSSPTPSNK